jgi:hypothetical protein
VVEEVGTAARTGGLFKLELVPNVVRDVPAGLVDVLEASEDLVVGTVEVDGIPRFGTPMTPRLAALAMPVGFGDFVAGGDKASAGAWVVVAVAGGVSVGLSEGVSEKVSEGGRVAGGAVSTSAMMKYV